MIIVTENDGPRIVASTYWDSPAAAAGKIYVSPNAGCFRILVPDQARSYVADLATARGCAVSRGPWLAVGWHDAFEILFDDDSDAPFTLHLSPESFERLPAETDAGHRWTLSVWTRGPTCELERPCRYRLVPSLPYLKPWEEP